FSLSTFNSRKAGSLILDTCLPHFGHTLCRTPSGVALSLCERSSDPPSGTDGTTPNPFWTIWTHKSIFITEFTENTEVKPAVSGLRRDSTP
ncbi:MAG: hypothetical protein WCI51_22540, partial [Lentisphaerota bacterium]